MSLAQGKLVQTSRSTKTGGSANRTSQLEEAFDQQHTFALVRLFAQTVLAIYTGRDSGDLGITNTQVRKVVEKIQQDRPLTESILAQVSARFKAAQPLAKKGEPLYNQVLAILKDQWPKRLRSVFGLHLSPGTQSVLAVMRVGLAFICPPLALLSAGKPVQAAINSVIFGISLLGVLRYFISFGSIASYGLMAAVMHALFAGLET